MSAAPHAIGQHWFRRLRAVQLRQVWGQLQLRAQRWQYARVLRRQLAEVNALVESLDRDGRRRLAEMIAASNNENPGVERRGRANYLPSAESFAALRRNGYPRISSSSLDVRLQGLSMWLRGAQRETEITIQPEIRKLGVAVLRLNREVRQCLPVATPRAA